MEHAQRLRLADKLQVLPKDLIQVIDQSKLILLIGVVDPIIRDLMTKGFSVMLVQAELRENVDCMDLHRKASRDCHAVSKLILLTTFQIIIHLENCRYCVHKSCLG